LHRSSPAWDVASAGHRAYAALDASYVGVVDVSDAGNPVVLLPRERQLRITFPGNDER
jgi:hypothetical protein